MVRVSNLQVARAVIQDNSPTKMLYYFNDRSPDVGAIAGGRCLYLKEQYLD